MLRRIVSLFTLCSFLTGCSGLHPAALPVDPTAPQDDVEARTVHVGMQAKVTLRSGETVDGEVTAVSPDSISLGKPGNYGYTRTTIAAADIASIEAEEDAPVVKAAGTALGVLFLFGLGITILLLHSVDGGGLS